MSDYRLILALERKRTTDTFGTYHNCVIHNQIVDKFHINECSHLAIYEHPVTDIVQPLANTNSIRNLELATLIKMQSSL